MLNIYTPDMVKVGVIANYESLIYSPHFYEVGTFEMYININKQYTEELKVDNIIQINDDKEKTMFITHRSLPLNESGKSGETLFIKGYTLDGLTARRNIVTDSDKPFMSFEGTQEHIMKQFVYNNMINAKDKERNIQGLRLSIDKNLGKQDKWRGRQEKLSDKLTEIGIYAELGWDIVFDTHKKEFVFDVKKGTNRQLDNKNNSPVIFELDFGNILSREFTEDVTNSANVIYVGGSGELEDKLIQKIGNKSGFSRIEVYQEHSNIDDVKELRTIGEQTLKQLEKTENFNTIVNPFGSYIYGEDYFLGDYVTIIDKQLNIKVNTQITGVKEINEGLNGIEITFGKMIPTIFNTMATSEKSRILDIPNKASGEDGKPGEQGKPGVDGRDGVGLNYHWNGTKLGIKREDDDNYSYMDLVGPQGKQGLQGLPGKDGSDASVTRDKIIKELGYTPLEKISWTDINDKPSVFKPAPHTHNDKADTTYVDERDNKIIVDLKLVNDKLPKYLLKDGSDKEIKLGKGQIFETHFSFDNWSFINNYTGGGWARGLLNIRDKDNKNYIQIGGYGSGQNFTHMYIGQAYNNTIITLNPQTQTANFQGILNYKGKEVATKSDIPEGVDLKPVYTKIDDLDNKKADKTIKDETTTNEYELVVRDGKPFLRVTK